jgi:hypothetical protein
MTTATLNKTHITAYQPTMAEFVPIYGQDATKNDASEQVHFYARGGRLLTYTLYTNKK